MFLFFLFANRAEVWKLDFLRDADHRRGGRTQTGHRFKLDSAVKIKDNNFKIFLSRSSYVKFNVTTDENSSSLVSALFNTVSRCLASRSL